MIEPGMRKVQKPMKSNKTQLREPAKEKAEFELVKQKEKRIEDLGHFQYVHERMKSAGLRSALAKKGYTYDDMERAKDMISVCKSYMSHRAYG